MPTRLSLTTNSLANTLNKPIAKCLKDAKVFKDDKDLISLYRQDAKDLNTIRNFVIAGRFDLAAKKAHYLDTDVRESIPMTLYNILSDVVAAKCRH